MLTIKDAQSKELNEEIFLTHRVCGVVTALSKELREDSEALSKGMINKSVIKLPTKQVAPFAIHLKEGSLMIFWAVSETERKQWIKAFKFIEYHEEQESSNSPLKSQSCSNN